MSKVLLDTNVYVDWLRDNRHHELIFDRHWQYYLAASVAMELYAGVQTAASKRRIDRIVERYEATHRLVFMTPHAVAEAGKSLALLKTQGFEIRRASFLADVLLAKTAVAIGAVVVTADRDFLNISRVLPVAVHMVKA